MKNIKSATPAPETTHSKPLPRKAATLRPRKAARPAPRKATPAPRRKSGALSRKAERLLATAVRPAKGQDSREYMRFTSTDGRTIHLAGRQRQHFALLILKRAESKGLSQRAVAGNLAENMRLTAQRGLVLIGISSETHPDASVFNGRAPHSYYYLLEDWLPSSELFTVRNSQSELPLNSSIPTAVEPVPANIEEHLTGRFVRAGFVKAGRSIRILNPVSGTRKAAALEVHRDIELARIAAELAAEKEAEGAGHKGGEQ